ncbi:MAG: hypothetical protein WCI67_04010 [Chloroflexales bacterium]
MGQILATTPISRPHYMLGKWLSNFLVLALLVGILLLAAVTMQLIQREDAQIQRSTRSTRRCGVALQSHDLAAFTKAT